MRALRFLAVAAIGILAATNASAQQNAIKVGVILPLSGGAGPQGQHVTQAIQAMAAIINESGGVMGRPIEILSRDDESTPAVGVSRANDLISSGASVIIEGWNSPVALAMQPVINRAGILDITAFASADSILSGEGNPLAIRLNASNSQGGAAVAALIANKLKAKRIAFLTENDAYGNGTQESIEAELKRMNYAYEKVAEEKFPFNQSDFRIALTNVRAANPDATIAINANEGLGMPALIRQAKQSRLPGQLVAALGTVAPSVISVAGDAANGVMGVDIYFPNVEPFTSYEANKKFVAKTEEMFKYTPDKFMAVGAFALQVWAMAANELKTLDKEPLAKRIRGGSFKDTVFGDATFEANGQLKSRIYPFTVQDQKIVVDLAR
ncbi:ABC transporter substrate-binding protein [Microvirga pudoricolor]|uniref:ABC transporter substrate-binding protein n=1 Tax=Microvirga pudoricolor TaxID=2778729 RepID=UPI00194F5228|nr:ABC transporter substrate-binding protein [Microvirga pudoricolor]MBM6594422.1 ABC transporter substrate-binding protein [Microvirga pudoricolor]